jgi:ketosteroid isomerase-like protein
MIKHISIFILLAAILISCAKEQKPIELKPEDPAKLRQDIENLLLLNVEGYKTKNIDKIMATYANVPEVTALASSFRYKAIGWENIKAMFSQDLKFDFSLINYDLSDMEVHQNDSIAWMHVDILAKGIVGEQTLENKARMTAVMKKISGKWLFVMTHFQSFMPEAPAVTPITSKDEIERNK